ncbi:MAG: glycogen-binding domain-containing protein [Planctomycetota bacterium]
MRTSKSTLNNSSTSTIASRMAEVKATPAGPSKSYGPRQMGDSVLFTAFYPEANAIQIAGDFNGWRPEKNPMKKAGDGTWQARIPLAKGTYRYRFVVDGKWQHDPHNGSTEPNPYGELNSVFKVI